MGFVMDLGLELGERLGSAGHDPVLVYFFDLKCSKKDAKWATDAKRYGFHNWIFNSKEDHFFFVQFQISNSEKPGHNQGDKLKQIVEIVTK